MNPYPDLDPVSVTIPRHLGGDDLVSESMHRPEFNASRLATSALMVLPPRHRLKVLAFAVVFAAGMCLGAALTGNSVEDTPPAPPGCMSTVPVSAVMSGAAPDDPSTCSIWGVDR